MAWFRGTRIETVENGTANARINQQAIAKEMDIMNRVLRRYHTPHQILRRTQKDPEIQKALTRLFGLKLGYEIQRAQIVLDRGEEKILLETVNGPREFLINTLENEITKEIDLIAHTYSEYWYTKRLNELYPLAYNRAHLGQVHTVN